MPVDRNIRQVLLHLGETNPAEHLSIREMCKLRDHLTRTVRKTLEDWARDEGIKGPGGHLWDKSTTLCTNMRYIGSKNPRIVNCVGCLLVKYRD